MLRTLACEELLVAGAAARVASSMDTVVEVIVSGGYRGLHVADNPNYSAGTQLNRSFYKACGGFMTGQLANNSILQHSRNRATEEAITLWALVGSQWPLDNGAIQNRVTVMVVEAISVFSLNARRTLEAIPNRSSIRLDQPRWKWEPLAEGEVVGGLSDAMNRIIHARKLDVGWEELPAESSVIASGAVVVPYVRAETDRRELAFIDPFAMAHAFLYKALPLLDFGSSSNVDHLPQGRPQ